MHGHLIQALSLLGAVLVLCGYGGQQYAGLRGDGVIYGLLNLLGSGLLAVSAFRPLNAGVLVLEATWAAISLGIIVQALRHRH